MYNFWHLYIERQQEGLYTSQHVAKLCCFLTYRSSVSYKSVLRVKAALKVLPLVCCDLHAMCLSLCVLTLWVWLFYCMTLNVSDVLVGWGVPSWIHAGPVGAGEAASSTHITRSWRRCTGLQSRCRGTGHTALAALRWNVFPRVQRETTQEKFIFTKKEAVTVYWTFQMTLFYLIGKFF